MSIDATRWAWAQSITAGRAVALLSRAARGGARGLARASVGRQAADTALGQRTLYRHIAALAARGLLDVESTPAGGAFTGCVCLRAGKGLRPLLPSRMLRSAACPFPAALARMIFAGTAHPPCRSGRPPATAAKASKYGTTIEPSRTPTSRAVSRGGAPSTVAVFLEAYPRKTGKKAALRAWRAARDRPGPADLLAALERQKQSAQWRRDGGRYIPNPATWLNQGRWDDEPEIPAAREQTLDEYLAALEQTS